MLTSFDPTILPACFRAVDVRAHHTPISPKVEIARWLAAEERRLGHRPVVAFDNVIGQPGAVVVGNPCPRPVLLSAMGLAADRWLTELADRLAGPGAPVGRGRGRWRALRDMDELPVVWHRPGDAGPYITAGVTITHSLSGTLNLGVYRIQVVDGTTARIFFDPRTDAHRNWRAHIDAGTAMPVTIFIGADPVCLLAGASRLPVRGSDFEVVAQLKGAAVELDDELGVPTDAQYVLRGEVGAEVATEGPFAEFKGFYVPARQSPVLRVSDVLAAPRPYYPTIVTGAESGLTLMSVQNEYLMYRHLVTAGFPVDSVRYPHSHRGEFLAVIRSPEPTHELLRAAMACDPRAKLVVCGASPEDVGLAVAAYGMSAVVVPYERKGAPYGDRVGLLFDRVPDGRPVEF
jgi:2,5-furandicarboxylate decarboxylase 1